jgi:serine/threonine-protein kinase
MDTADETQSPPAGEREPPRVLVGRYRLERTIGTGASATVWLAFDTVLERRVAVKILTPGRDGVPEKLERFRREARALAKLGHPHIVTVIDTGEDGNANFIVLEYVAGETLKSRIRRGGRLPIDEAIAYAIEVARALAAAHERGIVHRDVKSQNILIDPDDGAKLTDFGIARSGAEVALTQGGRVLGTTDYVSPEQALGHEVTGQSDLYSLGVVLYEALTGAVPFTGSSQLAVASMHVRAQIPDVQRSRPEVSAALAAIVDRATAKRLDRRYPDARAMVADLERALTIETARAGDASAEANVVLRTLPELARSRLPMRVRHPSSLLASVIVVVLVLGAVLAFAFAHIHTNPQRSGGPEVVERPANLSGAVAVAYNPFGSGIPDDANGAQLALSRRPHEAWATNRYAAGALGKPGVGVYVALRRALAVNRVGLSTATPGFTLEIWGANVIATRPADTPRALGALGWQRLARVDRVETRTLVDLRAPTMRYRYYLVWITRLQPDPSGVWISAQVADLRLLSAVRD